MGCNSSKAPAAAPQKSTEEPTKTLAEYAASVNALSPNDLTAAVAALSPEIRKKLEDAISEMEGQLQQAQAPPSKEETVNAPAKEPLVEEAVASKEGLVVEGEGADKNDTKADPLEDESTRDEDVDATLKALVEQGTEDPVALIPELIVEGKSDNADNTS